GWTAEPVVRTAVVQQGTSTIRYSGTWRTAIGSTLSGGSTRGASTKGASATYTFSGNSIGWVATRSTSRGNAYVYVDGVSAGIVSLYSTSYHARTIVFARSWSTVGTHTIQIIVAGTTHHPYVDVDAFVRLGS